MHFHNWIDRAIARFFLAIGLFTFVLVNVAISDSVSSYQLDAVYSCSIVFTEEERKARCRNERAGFGHIRVLSAAVTS